MCYCNEHYEGRHCDIVKDKCEVNRCMNGGSCFHDQNTPLEDFICECVEGFTGQS